MCAMFWCLLCHACQGAALPLVVLNLELSYGSHDKEVRGIPDVRVLMLRCERVAQVVHSGEPPLRSTRDVLPGP